ncbi:SPW repeat protein [Streptomyces sp. NPDC059866]|uniref:SPW repeat protein n=1 Tax=Streptomyces sp. NPDC059866 TaxID=3346978 RepID=UPI00364EC658
MATAPRPDMAAHPDIIAMRERHEMAERNATTPRAQAIETMALITGLYLAASPWITGFNGFSTLAVNNLIVGIAYALIMSGGFGRAYDRVHSMAWAACALSVWTIVSPWVVAGDVSTTKTIVNNVIVGVIALLLALTAASIGRPADRETSSRMSAPYGGGRS